MARTVLGPTLLLLLLPACGADQPAPPTAPLPAGDAAVPGGSDGGQALILPGAPLAASDPMAQLFPVSYDKSQIELVSASTRTEQGVTFKLDFYRDKAYRCGKQGYFTFLVVQQSSIVGKRRPLWVLMHGGGVGYYQPDGLYVGNEGANNEETADRLSNVLVKHALSKAGAKKTIVGGRVQAGWRFLMPSMCDHDLYGGMGNAYPNNPNWSGSPDTVDGLRATMAAIDFTARGNGKLPGYATGRIFLQGTSAGSAGAYNVAHAFERSGVQLNGAILDSYLVSSGLEEIFGHGCTTTEVKAAAQGATFDLQAVEQKVGAFLSEEPLLAENSLGLTHHVPLFDIAGSLDGFCCGKDPALPAAAAAGYDNNCRFVHSPLAQAIAALPATAHHRSLVVEGLGHVITGTEGAHQAALQSWLDGILADNPPPPWP